MVRAAFSILFLHITVGLVREGRADDWPQYRGPKSDGVSRETGLLKMWPKGGPKLLWTYRDAGAGFSPPSIVGNHIYCMGSKDKDDVVFALDTQTGKLLWTASAGPRRLTDWGDGPCSTPTVDGDYLYAISVLGELHCINRRAGKHVWQVHLKNDLQGKILHDGRYCESPLVDRDRVICSPGGKGGTFAAFDKKTGKLLWRSKELTDEAVSSSVIVTEIEGLRQYVNLTGKGVAGVAAEDGRLLWKSGIPAAWIMVATPIHHEDSIYVTTAYGVGCGLLKLKRDDQRIKTEVVYRSKVMKNHHSGVIGPLLVKLARDSHPRVRAEAVIAATFYNGPDAPEAVFAAGALPADVHLDFVLKEAAKSLKVDNYLANAKKAGKLSPAAQQYALRTLSIDKLLQPGADAASYRAVLARAEAKTEQIESALKGLADAKKLSPLVLATELSDTMDAEGKTASLNAITRFVAMKTAEELRPHAARWKKLAAQGKTAEARRLGYVAWMTADASADDVFSFAGGKDARLADVLAAAKMLESPAARATLYPHVSTLLGSKNDGTLALALAVLPRIPDHEAEIVRDLAALIKTRRQSEAAIAILKNIPEKHWRKEEVRSLVDNLVAQFTELPAKQRTQTAAQEALNLARKLAKLLPPQQAAEIELRLKNADVRVIAIGTVFERMIYDRDKIVVEAGRPVEFRFSNTDAMPHNLAIIKPGTLEEIGTLAETTAQEADAAKRHFIPKSPHVLLGSKLLQPGESQALAFDVPKTPGVYPIVCTYPGHWRRMYASLYVVGDLAAYQANPESYLAKTNLAIKDPLLKISTQGHAWTVEELTPDVKTLAKRSFDVGKSAFKVANCVACHKLNGEGVEFGPDLAKLDAKLGAVDILVDILEPSKRINEKYHSYTFTLTSGRTITGLVVADTPESYLVIDNPLAKGKPLSIKKADVDERVKSPISLMPKGLLDRLSREEVLDLVAYIVARGNRNHAVFMPPHHEHHGGKGK